MKNWLTVMFLCAAGLVLEGQSGPAPRVPSIAIRVSETAGIRRNNYPVSTRIRLAPGQLADADHVRLMMNGSEIAGQFAVESTYPDRSVQWLDVDSNVSLGPREEAALQLEFGPGVTSAVKPRGLAVSRDATGVQIGNVHTGSSAWPLLTSVKYRQEDIATGLNGFTITDVAGVVHDASSGQPPKVDVVKPGPLLAVVRYTGEISLSPNYSVGYALTVEMPNSKSWVKTTTAIADPQKQVRSMAFHTPLALGTQPWTWDFGTTSWSYGIMRDKNDSALLIQSVGTPQATKWEIKTGPKGQEQSYETNAAGRSRVAEGWGHIQDQHEVVAFAVGDFGAESGTYTCALGGDGQISFRWTPSRPLPHLQLMVFEHFVSSPVQIGAVTSPVSMLHPLVVSVLNPQ